MFHSKTLDVTYCTRPLTGFFSPLSRRQDISHTCKRSPGLPHVISCYTKRPYDGELFQLNYTLSSLKKNYHAKCYRVFEAHFNNTFSANFVPVFPLFY